MTARVRRPSLWGVVASLVAVGLLIGGCGGASEGSQKDDSSRAEGSSPVAGSFVGEAPNFGKDVPDNNAFVAVVANGAEEGEGDKREVRAYLCSGGTINEWFWGDAEGNKLDLTSQGGARLVANLAPETVTGTVTLEDGTSSNFTADPATGIAGLYSVNTTPDLRVLGTSETGNRLEGRVAGEPDEDGIYEINGTITVPDGPTQDITTLITVSPEPAEARWVVLQDGQAKGGRKAEKGAGFSLWDIMF